MGVLLYLKVLKVFFFLDYQHNTQQCDLGTIRGHMHELSVYLASLSYNSFHNLS